MRSLLGVFPEMSKEFIVRRYSLEQLEAVLDLSARSISTTRTIDTWIQNNMTAVLAYSGNDLIGAIPLERRILVIGGDRETEVLWVSGAHVDEQYRSAGVGSAMDRSIEAYFSEEASGVCVYRGNPQSAAFRWYKKNDYKVVASIVSLERDAQISCRTGLYYKVLSKLEDIEQISAKLKLAFERKYCNASGFVPRSSRYWADKIKYHLYRQSYQYSVLMLDRKTDLSSYAFLGQTSLGDGQRRLDIFEFVAIETERQELLDAVADYALSCRIPSLRIRCIEEGIDYGWLIQHDFSWQNQFFMKARMFDPSVGVSANCFFHSDYI